MTGIGAYVIETDGTIHEMMFAGDGNWKKEAVTTLSNIRNKAIDEFAEQLKTLELGWFNSDLEREIASRQINRIAEHLKEKSNENSSNVCW